LDKNSFGKTTKGAKEKLDLSLDLRNINIENEQE